MLRRRRQRANAGDGRLQPVSKTKGHQRKCLKWLNSYPLVSAHFSDIDIISMLEANHGLFRVDNFLPDFIAEGILSLLEGISDDAWNVTAAGEDNSQNNIDHVFWSTKEARGLSSIFRALSMLLPENLNTFSAAKYCTGHHIAPHDDRAYTNVLMEDGQQLLCSRDIAVIYYLTKDWKVEYGGELVDLETGHVYPPKFNSLVVFKIPRYHEVKEVKTSRPRYSIFGWFLEPGVKYSLYTGEKEESEHHQPSEGADDTVEDDATIHQGLDHIKKRGRPRTRPPRGRKKSRLKSGGNNR